MSNSKSNLIDAIDGTRSAPQIIVFGVHILTEEGLPECRRSTNLLNRSEHRAENRMSKDLGSGALNFWESSRNCSASSKLPSSSADTGRPSNADSSSK